MVELRYYKSTSNMSYSHKSPLLNRRFKESEKGGPQFFLKYETLQPSGSFKSRGIGYLINSKAKEARSRDGSDVHVFSSSGGNAGLAAATASKLLNLNCTVVVPVTTKRHMIDRIQSAGSQVIVHGTHWGMADTYLKEVIMKKVPSNVEPLYVHPFDDPLVWKGHSFMIDEIVQQLQEQGRSMRDVKGIICSVGGGGLYNGIVTGLERHGYADKIPIIAVETVGADALAKSLVQGKPVRLTEVTSIASSLGSPYIAQDSFEKAIRYKTKSFVQTDEEAVRTSLRFFQESNILVEPACAASVSLCYHVDELNRLLGCKLGSKDIVIAIVCGGSATTISDLEMLQRRYNPKL